jgi:uncharacterized paraquat-inducible protein A
MIKTILAWISVWSILTLIYFIQSNHSAAFTLLCVAYMPVFALLIVYLLPLKTHKEINQIRGNKVIQHRDFRVNILLTLIGSFLLILSLSLPETTQDERAIKTLLMFAFALITTAIALISFVDAFITPKIDK